MKNAMLQLLLHVYLRYNIKQNYYFKFRISQLLRRLLWTPTIHSIQMTHVKYFLVYSRPEPPIPESQRTSKLRKSLCGSYQQQNRNLDIFLVKVTKKLEIVFSASIVILHILQWNGEKQELIIPFVKKLWFILTALVICIAAFKTTVEKTRPLYCHRVSFLLHTSQCNHFLYMDLNSILIQCHRYLYLCLK